MIIVMMIIIFTIFMGLILSSLRKGFCKKLSNFSVSFNALVVLGTVVARASENEYLKTFCVIIIFIMLLLTVVTFYIYSEERGSKAK